MLFKSIIGVGLLSLSVFSCQNNNTNTTTEDINQEIVNDLNDTEVAGLLVNNCYSCHAVNATKENRIAPPMAHIKAHYNDKYKTKEGFILAMTAFVNNPNTKNAILTNAVEKFGAMPNMQFDKTDVNKIVEYIYTTSIDTDDWMSKNGKVKAPKIKDGDYIALGRHIVMSTKKQLGKNLKKTIKTKGTIEAVTFCNLKAMPILDSMMSVHNSKIRRVTNKPRNQNNLANALETALILKYQSQINNGEDLKPTLNETDELATFYMPIVTNDMCMKCHASSNKIDKKTLTEINKLYPKDIATGYSSNQIRGIWRIEMTKN